MKTCIHCLQALPGGCDKRNKFCSRKCAAIANNLGRKRNLRSGKWSKKPCLVCSTFTKNAKFCSRACNIKSSWQQRKTEITKSGHLLSVEGLYGYNPTMAKKYLVETRGYRCEICTLSTWRDRPIPLILDHINGDPTNHQLSNIRLICGNCNMQLPTFAGKNRGNGRKNRKTFYR